MRILLTGNSYPTSPEQIYLNCLRKQDDIEASLFETGTIFRKRLRNLFNKLLYRLYPRIILNTIGQQLERQVSTAKPDILLVFKGMEIPVSSLIRIKKQGVKLVNFNGDHPFKLVSSGSGNRTSVNSIPLYDLYLTYSSMIKRETENRYDVPVEVLPFGVSAEVTRQTFNESEINEVCFVGNYDIKREEYVKVIANSGLTISVYGHGWDKLSHEHINIHPPVLGNDYWKTLFQYRIQLNILRAHNNQSHNMRSFEIPGVGGIMLAEYSSDHELYFEDEKEIFLFKTKKDLVKKCEEILNMSPQSASEVRQRAKTRITNSGHTYNNRSSSLVNMLYKLITN